MMRLMFNVGIRRLVLLAALCIAAHELVYATCCVDELRLTCVEGVRSVGDFQLNERIGLTFELDGLVGLAGRAAEEHVTVAHVLEHNGTVILWMKSFFHFDVSFCAPDSSLDTHLEVDKGQC